MSVGSTDTNFLEDMMSQHITPASHSVKEFVDETGVTRIHGLRLLNAIAMDDPDAYKSKQERLYRIHQKTDLKTQKEYIEDVENRGKFLQRESTRRLATVIYEDKDPSNCSDDGSEDEVDEAMSITASETLSKLAGSSDVAGGKTQTTPPLALRTRGKAKVSEPLKKLTQPTSKSTPVKLQPSRKGSLIKQKQPLLSDKSCSSSPQTAALKSAPGPMRQTRPVGPASQESYVELSEFSTPDFTALPYYKQLKLRLAHQNARHTQLLNQTLAQLVSTNQKNGPTIGICHCEARYVSKPSFNSHAECWYQFVCTTSINPTAATKKITKKKRLYLLVLLDRAVATNRHSSVVF